MKLNPRSILSGVALAVFALAAGLFARGGDGRYELTGLKPGEYEVSAALPDYYYKGEYSTRKVKLYDRGCAEASFAAIPDGRITGQVVDAEGEPVRRAEVVLISPKAGGHLSMRDYDGVSYWVLASADKFPAAPFQERQATHAEPPSLTLTNSVSGLKLVLTSEGSLCKHYYQEKSKE